MSSAEGSAAISGPGRIAGRQAAERVEAHNTLRVDVPGLGHVTLPPADQLAFLGGVAALTVLGVLDWPIGLLLGAGHLIASSRGSKVLREFGEALEEA